MFGFTANGIDADGKVTVVMATLAGVSTIAHAFWRAGKLPAAWMTVLFGLGIFRVGTYDLVRVMKGIRDSGPLGSAISLGIGLFLTAISGVALTAIADWSLTAIARDATRR
ncbi:hypothetical protein [Nocardia sp. CNY236]|uniref:hypothetical protein n=1 Tax=Nocardia sp. CNY236 TaxID=1169152 RepID=UPI00040D056F|nr:hypothetical protein [Nocardia sp. CNY236]